MKIRYGFVSNSSSSSFTCEICGEEASGMDMGLSEAGMVRCQRDHTFCEDHQLEYDLTIEEKRAELIRFILARKYYTSAVNQSDADKYKTASDEVIENDFSDYNDELFPQFCPLCQLEDVTDSDVRNYTLVKMGLKNSKELAAVLKKEFGTYEKFQDYIRPPVTPT